MAVETTASVETVVSVPAAESLGNSLSKDVGVWEELERTIETKGHSFKHVLELWPAYIRRLHLGRFIAHFKLFEQVAGLPGSIVDLGVYRGASLLGQTCSKFSVPVIVIGSFTDSTTSRDCKILRRKMVRWTRSEVNTWALSRQPA